jgi:hypothetical protein
LTALGAYLTLYRRRAEQPGPLPNAGAYVGARPLG